MSSLKERISQLEGDLRATPMRISAYHDLPLAILRYEPDQEWELRREARHLATRLGNAGKEVRVISLAELLWEAIERSEGLDAVVELERALSSYAAWRPDTAGKWGRHAGNGPFRPSNRPITVRKCYQVGSRKRAEC